MLFSISQQIGSRWVLTAAHCTYTSNATDLEVRVGSSNHRIGGTLVDVKQIIQHENFNRFTIDFDYALLELTHALPSNHKKIKAVNLPQQNDELENGSKCLVSGWGDTRNAEISRVVLRAATVPYVDHEICSLAYADFGGMTEQMICAGYIIEGGRDACQGDSGGPLVINSTVYGIVSWGFNCAEPSYPGVYSKVSVIREWIRGKTGV